MAEAMRPSSSRVVAAFLLLGFLEIGDAVADGFNAGQGGGPRGERPEQQEGAGQPHQALVEACLRARS